MRLVVENLKLDLGMLPVPVTPAMKFKVFLGSLAWLVLITVLHVQLNVGWASLGKKLRVAFGGERQELVVGFLPVT